MALLLIFNPLAQQVLGAKASSLRWKHVWHTRLQQQGRWLLIAAHNSTTYLQYHHPCSTLTNPPQQNCWPPFETENQRSHHLQEDGGKMVTIPLKTLQHFWLKDAWQLERDFSYCKNELWRNYFPQNRERSTWAAMYIQRLRRYLGSWMPWIWEEADRAHSTRHSDVGNKKVWTVHVTKPSSTGGGKGQKLQGSLIQKEVTLFCLRLGE